MIGFDKGEQSWPRAAGSVLSVEGYFMAERELIELIFEGCGDVSGDPDTLLGMGDDCAVVDARGALQCQTIDSLVEGVHFDLSYTSAWMVGRKTASVNLSDVASMGGEPRWALLSIAVPPGFSPLFWKGFTRGLCGRLAQYGTRLVGGDTVATRGPLVITLSVTGVLSQPVYRSGAREGDFICLSGPIGEAGAGLSLLRGLPKPWSLPGPMRRRLVRRHLDPTPRVELGRLLGKMAWVSAMVDISDGVATDLAHVCEASGLGARLFEEALPVSKALARFARCAGRSATRLALTGGEDFELLWTVDPQGLDEVMTAASRVIGRRPFVIGRMVNGEGVILRDNHGDLHDITFSGYEHGI